MKAFKTEGIVIKRRNFLESDKIITVFSKTKGVITIKAPGVRKITSRRSAHIELFNHCNFTLHQGKNMPILTEIETIENFKILKKDLKRIGVAYHLCELIEGLCAENQEHLQVFDLFLENLNKLSDSKDLEKLTYDFEIELLNLLGFYKHDILNGEINTAQKIEGILERKLKTKGMLPRFS